MRVKGKGGRGGGAAVRHGSRRGCAPPFRSKVTRAGSRIRRTPPRVCARLCALCRGPARDPPVLQPAVRDGRTRSTQPAAGGTRGVIANARVHAGSGLETHVEDVIEPPDAAVVHAAHEIGRHLHSPAPSPCVDALRSENSASNSGVLKKSQPRCAHFVLTSAHGAEWHACTRVRQSRPVAQLVQVVRVWGLLPPQRRRALTDPAPSRRFSLTTPACD